MKKIFVALLLVWGMLYGQADNKIVFRQDVQFQRDTNNEDIRTILKAIAKLNGSQIRIDEDVKGKETFNFNMPLQGAFNMIIEEHKLNYKVQDGVIIVSGSKIEKKILVLRYLKAQKLKKLLDSYDIIDRSVNKIEFGKGMDNTVFIEGKSTVIKELEALIGQLEKAEELKQKEAKLIAQQKQKEKEQKRKAELEKKRLDLQKQEQLRELKRLEIDKNKARLDGLRQQQQLSQDEIIFNNKLTRINKKMLIDVIPLKYINVSKSEMEFQGQKIQVESLEDTLKGLIGTKFSDENGTIDIDGDSAFLKIDQRTNSVIIKDFPERVKEIRKILKDPKIGLDRPPLLVEIEVTIAMGNSGFTEELGMKLGGVRHINDGTRDYGFSTGDSVTQNLNDMRQTPTTETTTTSNGAVSTSEAQAINSAFQTATLLQPIGALGLSSSMLFMGRKNILNIELNAMENEGLGKVLSNPRIITLNNREATIISGNSVSIPTATSDKMSLETVDTGISIKAKPHIVIENGADTKNADILLDIAIEKSSLGVVTREKIEKATSQIESNVIIKNGQTLILGGLFQYTKSDSTGGVPILKEIPLIGLFFKTKNNTLSKNELVFFITPKVITPSMVNKMQNDTYMDYKKNLEFHKQHLIKKLDKIDNTDVKKIKNSKEFNNLELLSGTKEDNEDY